MSGNTNGKNTVSQWKVDMKKNVNIGRMRDLLLTNDTIVMESICMIHDNQTAEEQEVMETHDSNGIGFNAVDANLLSSFARQIKRGRTLTPKQMHYARKKIVKYARQICNIVSTTF